MPSELDRSPDRGLVEAVAQASFAALGLTGTVWETAPVGTKKLHRKIAAAAVETVLGRVANSLGRNPDAPLPPEIDEPLAELIRADIAPLIVKAERDREALDPVVRATILKAEHEWIRGAIEKRKLKDPPDEYRTGFNEGLQEALDLIQPDLSALRAIEGGQR